MSHFGQHPLQNRIETSSLPPPWMRSYEHRPTVPPPEHEVDLSDAGLVSPGSAASFSRDSRRVGVPNTSSGRLGNYFPDGPDDVWPEASPPRASATPPIPGDTGDGGLRSKMEQEPSRHRRVRYEDEVDIQYPSTRRAHGSMSNYRAYDDHVHELRQEHSAYLAVRDADADDDLDVFYSFGDSLSDGKQGSDLSPAVSDTESIGMAEDDQDTADPDVAGRGVPAYHVLESQYDGDGFEEGHHTISLTAVLSERAAVPQSLFRWIHFTRPAMDIDEFATQIAAIPGLSNAEIDALQTMVANIKRDNVKTIQAADGRYVRYLEPKFRQDSLASGSQALASQTVTWICLPYFSLEAYSGFLGSNNPRAFPMPTLLQARYSRTTRNRDMEQAVCQQSGAPKGLCFHVAQLWCLILNNSLLLTYGRITEGALCQGILTRAVKSILDPPGTAANKTLAVRYRQDIMWSIPIQACQTWLAFVSHFRNYYPCRLRFRHHSTTVKGSNWPRIYELALRSRRKLVLDLELRPPQKQTESVILPPLRQHNDHRSAPTPQSTVGLTDVVHGVVQQHGNADLNSINNEELLAPVSPPRVQVTQNETLSPSSTVEGQSRRASFSVAGHSPSPQGRNRNRQASIRDRNSPFAVFTCLEVVSNSLSPTSLRADVPASSSAAADMFKHKTVVRYFKNIDNHLQTKTILSDRQAIAKCESNYNRQDVYSLLDRERQNTASWTLSLEEQKDYEKRFSVFSLADAIFGFFFPPETVVSTTSRFWGAVEAIVHEDPSPSENSSEDIQVVSAYESQGSVYSRRNTMSRDFRSVSASSRIDSLLAVLRGINGNILWFNEISASVQPADRDQITTPLTLVNAWVHIILAFATFPTDLKRSLALAKKAKSQINRGIQQMIAARSEPLQLQNLVLLPFDIVSLISMKLAKDITPGLPNISETYGSYLNAIDSDIITKPSDRRIEHKLGLLKQELSIIEWTVDLQKFIIKMMLSAREALTKPSEASTREDTDPRSGRRSGRRRDDTRRSPTEIVDISHREAQDLPYESPSQQNTMVSMIEAILKAGEPKGFSHVLLQECLKNLRQRRAEFREMGVVVADMVNTVRSLIPAAFLSLVSLPGSSTFLSSCRTPVGPSHRP
ncbi:hypothetical protein VTI74DRAFT_11210 [Chaetomium olivicolor]